jgi:hypothetical protein
MQGKCWKIAYFLRNFKEVFEKFCTVVCRKSGEDQWERKREKRG